jgi:hypothetical protein
MSKKIYASCMMFVSSLMLILEEPLLAIWLLLVGILFKEFMGE